MKRRLLSIKAPRLSISELRFWWPALVIIILLCLMIILRNPYIQECAIVALVFVTFMYVVFTKRILDETRHSVAEMRKQRYISSQPWVFPNLVNDEGEFIDARSLSLSNIGNGPAIALKSFISDGDVTRIADEWKRRTGPSDSRSSGPSLAILKASQSIPWAGAFEAPKAGDAGVIAVEYRDIYGREFLSGWAYRVDIVETPANDYNPQQIRVLLVPGVPLYPVWREDELKDTLRAQEQNK